MGERLTLLPCRRRRNEFGGSNERLVRYPSFVVLYHAFLGTSTSDQTVPIDTVTRILSCTVRSDLCPTKVGTPTQSAESPIVDTTMSTSAQPSIAGAFPIDLELVSEFQAPGYHPNAGNSLPEPNEILGHAPRNRRRLRKIKMMVMLAAGLAVIMGVGVGLSRAGKRGSRQQLGGNEKPGRRYHLLSQFLLDNSVSTKADLENVNSPQYKAANWMVKDDKYNWTLPEGVDIYHREGYAFIVRYIMVSNDDALHIFACVLTDSRTPSKAVVYYSFEGDNWPIKASFLTERRACDWQGFLLNSGDTSNFRDLGVECGVFNTLPVELILCE